VRVFFIGVLTLSYKKRYRDLSTVMKKLALILLALASGVASAQTTTNVNSSSNATLNTESTSSNMGNNLTNNFNSPGRVDQHVRYSGVTGTNTAVGLGSFSSSFSSDYCGGVAQGGLSVPYVTFAGGKPVLGEPGVACVMMRASVHSMEYAATYGNAAASATKAGNAQLAREYTDMSTKLARASVYMLCGLGPDVRQSYVDAGIDCPPSKEERAQAANQQAQQSNEPTDPIVRRRLGYPPLPGANSRVSSYEEFMGYTGG